MPMQTDLKAVIFMHKQAKYMYLSPCLSKNKFVFRVIGVFLAIFSIPLAYFLLTLRVTIFKKLPTSCFIMDLANFLMGYTCLAIFCATQNLYRSNWSKIVSNVVQTERMLKTMKFSLNKDYNFFLRYWILHSIYFLMHGLQMYDWTSRYSIYIILSYLAFRIVHYWAGFCTLMIYEWLNFIRRRYEHLDLYMKNTVSQRVLLVSHVVREMHVIGEVYKHLSEITVELNTLFAFHLFFLISVSMVLTLHGLSFSLVLLYTLVTSMAGFTFVALFFGNILVLVLAYEKLRNKRQSIIKTCLILAESMGPGEIKSELRDLTNFMRNLPVEITACGLFEMDFQLIFSYISVVFTYLIIILQFNMTFV